MPVVAAAPAARRRSHPQPTPTTTPPRDREDARFVYKRVPPELQGSQPDLAAALALLQRLWCQDYRGAWGALRHAWGPQLQPLASALEGACVCVLVCGVGGGGLGVRSRVCVCASVPTSARTAAGRLRQRMCELVERAYSTISPTKLAALLGCSEEAALAGVCVGGALGRSAAAARRRRVRSGSPGALSPHAPPPPTHTHTHALPAVAAERGWTLEGGLVGVVPREAEGRGAATEASLQRLAEYVVHLSQQQG